jgi:hypothetical protein
LVSAALDGRVSPAKIDAALQEAAIGRLVAEERRGLEQRIEPALLAEFGKRLEDGAADAVIGALRPQFDDAAGFLTSAMDVIGGFPSDPAEFLARASGEQQAAYQGLSKVVVALDRIGAIVSMLGPTGSFPVVADPRSIDPNLRAGWLHSVAVMCTSNDLLAACAAFQRARPFGHLSTSPWLRCQPFLHSTASAAERLRAWAERDWAAQEAERLKGGRLIDGVVVPDAARSNPFALDEAKAS